MTTIQTSLTFYSPFSSSFFFSLPLSFSLSLSLFLSLSLDFVKENSEIIRVHSEGRKGKEIRSGWLELFSSVKLLNHKMFMSIHTLVIHVSSALSLSLSHQLVCKEACRERERESSLRSVTMDYDLVTGVTGWETIETKDEKTIFPCCLLSWAFLFGWLIHGHRKESDGIVAREREREKMRERKSERERGEKVREREEWERSLESLLTWSFNFPPPNSFLMQLLSLCLLSYISGANSEHVNLSSVWNGDRSNLCNREREKEREKERKRKRERCKLQAVMMYHW